MPPPPHRPILLPSGHHPPLSSHSDHKTEVKERDGDKKMPLSSEIRVVMDEKVKGFDHEKTLIMVWIDDDQLDAGKDSQTVAKAKREAVDTARADGRKPTEAEITTAVSSVNDQASRIEVEADATEVRQETQSIARQWACPVLGSCSAPVL